MTVFHSCFPSQSPSMLALSYFTCIILHSSRVRDCMHLHVLIVCTCMCMHVPQALHVSACVCTYQELSWYLRLLACIETWVCICTRWLVSRAEHLSAFVHTHPYTHTLLVSLFRTWLQIRSLLTWLSSIFWYAADELLMQGCSFRLYGSVRFSCLRSVHQGTSRRANDNVQDQPTGAHDFSIYNTGKALFYEGLAVWFWEESRFSRFICAVIHLSIQLHGMWSWRVHLLSSACVYIRFYTSQSYWQLARILTEFCGPQISSLMQQAIIFGVCVCCYACVSRQLHTSFTRYLADHP
jgi:hypothetical protein